MSSVVEGPFRYIVRAGGARVRYPGLGKPYFPDTFGKVKCGNGSALSYATETVQEAWYYYKSVKSTGPVGTITTELYLDTSEANIASVTAPLGPSDVNSHSSPGFWEIRVNVTWPHPTAVRKVVLLDSSGAPHQGYRGFYVYSPGNSLFLYVDTAYPVPAGASVQIEHWVSYPPLAPQHRVVQGVDELVVYRINTQPSAWRYFDDKSEECRLIQRPYLEAELDAAISAPPLEFDPGHFALQEASYDIRVPTAGTPYSPQMYDALRVEVDTLRDTSQSVLIDIQMGVFTASFTPGGTTVSVYEHARWNRLMLAADPYNGPNLMNKYAPYDSHPGEVSPFSASAQDPEDKTCAGCGTISNRTATLTDGWVFTQLKAQYQAGKFTLLAQAKRGASVREFPISESTTMGPLSGETTIGGITWTPDPRLRVGQAYTTASPFPTGLTYVAGYVDWLRV